MNILKQIFAETIRPLEFKFHTKTPYPLGGGIKIHANSSGNITKMADMPIYGKKIENSFSRTIRPMTLGLGMKQLGCGSTKFVQAMILC